MGKTKHNNLSFFSSHNISSSYRFDWSVSIRGQSREEGISEVGEDAEQTESDNNTDARSFPHGICLWMWLNFGTLPDRMPVYLYTGITEGSASQPLNGAVHIQPSFREQKVATLWSWIYSQKLNCNVLLEMSWNRMRPTMTFRAFGASRPTGNEIHSMCSCHLRYFLVC